MSLSVVSYNLLSTDLASPTYHTRCIPENLATVTRFERLKTRLGTLMIGSRPIFCFQELSDTWIELLIPYLQSEDYTLIYDSQWLGVGTAYPNGLYRLQELKFVSIGNMLKHQLHRHDLSGSEPMALTPIKAWCESPDDAWELASKQKRRLLQLTLIGVDSHLPFCVFNVHLPCAFRTPMVMLIHAALTLETVQTLAETKPYVLAGDFNFRPGSPAYRLMTEGGDRRSDFEPSHIYITPELGANVIPVRSAYVVAETREPRFTNYSWTRDMPEHFYDTIDYVFVSPEFKVESVSKLRDDMPTMTFPNADEPSDHLPISATLQFDDLSDIR